MWACPEVHWGKTRTLLLLPLPLFFIEGLFPSSPGQSGNPPPPPVLHLLRLFPQCGFAPMCTGANQEPSSSSSCFYSSSSPPLGRAIPAMLVYLLSPPHSPPEASQETRGTSLIQQPRHLGRIGLTLLLLLPLGDAPRSWLLPLRLRLGALGRGSALGRCWRSRGPAGPPGARPPSSPPPPPLPLLLPRRLQSTPRRPKEASFRLRGGGT